MTTSTSIPSNAQSCRMWLDSFPLSGQSLDGQSTLPSIEPTAEECQTLHASIRTQFQSLLESHCPKVQHFLPSTREDSTDWFDRSSQKIPLGCWIISPTRSMSFSIVCITQPSNSTGASDIRCMYVTIDFSLSLDSSKVTRYSRSNECSIR